MDDDEFWALVVERFVLWLKRGIPPHWLRLVTIPLGAVAALIVWSLSTHTGGLWPPILLGAFVGAVVSQIIGAIWWRIRRDSIVTPPPTDP